MHYILWYTHYSRRQWTSSVLGILPLVSLQCGGTSFLNFWTNNCRQFQSSPATVSRCTQSCFLPMRICEVIWCNRYVPTRLYLCKFESVFVYYVPAPIYPLYPFALFHLVVEGGWSHLITLYYHDTHSYIHIIYISVAYKYLHIPTKHLGTAWLCHSWALEPSKLPIWSSAPAMKLRCRVCLTQALRRPHSNSNRNDDSE